MARISLKDVSLDIPILDANRSFRSALFSGYTGGRVNVENRKVNVRALENVSLEIKPGDRLGIVGHNGAGKTTLLRVLAGIFEPTSGTVTREGKITALFNASIGMDMDETGRENIYNLGLYMGMSPAEIQEKADEIIDFCELGDFISLPVRTYSSGMVVRLGFAVATALEPEIMLMDEGIGAGDARFAEKARERLNKFYGRLQTMVLASHSESFIREMCTTGILLEHGQLVYAGDIDSVMKFYAERVAAASGD